MPKIARKFLAHFINTAPASEAVYERLGKDLEELNVELNPEIETKNNILGESATNLSSYQPQYSVEPYYADEGTGLHTFLQDIIDNRKVLDDVKTDTIEVHLWEETAENSGVFTAYKEECIVEIQSYGGDTTGYQIPFNVHLSGNRVKGTFDTKTKTFTEESAPATTSEE